ncbi:hypothetical protein [Paraclostridium bifermentans]|uniref:hypothetical protein n=1 Tax=Paraclostridium bifermentans TaxID=1490 RepID=UPI00374F33A3
MCGTIRELIQNLDLNYLRDYKTHLDTTDEDITLIDYLKHNKNLCGKFKIDNSIRKQYFEWNILCEGLQRIKPNQFKMVYMDEKCKINETSDLTIYWLAPVSFEIEFNVNVRQVIHFYINLDA